ncbi:MAG TPA: hypothetical protein VHU86_06080 [Solirubrobacterales bacterium]|jgi:hypothetical protein|nr:hypothetical protein [Solirubrobacterales bacterium]
MTRSDGKRSRLGVLLAMALGVLALLALPSLAAAKDRNHDRIPDRWEKRHHLSLKVNQDRRDQDGDHLDNRGEFQAGDNPRNDDSDGDGVMDGNENAGTITSYDATTGKLTIALYGGETVTGLITEGTRINCGCDHGKGSGDDSGTASRPGEPGDDHGSQAGPPPPPPASGPPGQGDDENDNPPGHDGTPPGASEGPGQGADHPAANCTTADLVTGAVVKEAELELEHGTATFSEVDLGKSTE